MMTYTRTALPSLLSLVAVALLACGDQASSGDSRDVAALGAACMAQLAGPDAGATCPSGPDAGQPLATTDGALVVDADWLAAHLDDAAVQVVDSRAAGFPDGHLPGALPLPAGTLSTMMGDVAGQVATAQEAETILRTVGLRNGTTAVVYGAPPEYAAARVVWALRHLGHDARYLDGGYDGWVAGDGEVVTGDPMTPPPTDFTPGGDGSLRVTGDWVLQQLGDAPYADAAVQLVDARSAAEYTGGHIPTAIQVNWTDNFDGGLLLGTEQLAAPYADLDPAVTTIAYCRTGQRGSATWLVLAHLGFEDVRLYDGSMTEWGADERFPIETGP